MGPTDTDSNLSQPLVHHDGGCKSHQDGEQLGADRAADVVERKISVRVLPVLFMVTLVCYLDRTNISLAAVGMSKDIGISKKEYGLAASLFFVSYVAFQIPSNAVLKRVGAPLWMGIMLIAWGVTASLTAFVRNAVHLYFMRLLLGVFEAGTFPGTYYYLSLFYPEKRMPFALGVVFSGLFTGLCISAPLGGGLLTMDGVLGFGGWQWLLLVEGLPSVLLGILMMLYLPKHPSSCNFLSAEEKNILKGKGLTSSSTTPSVAQLLKTIVLNGQIGINVVAWNLQGIARYAALFWTPLWIDAMASGKRLDLKDGHANDQENNDNGSLAAFLTTIPYFCTAISSVVIGWTSSRWNDRKVHVIVITCVGAIVFCLLPLVNGLVPGITALCFIHTAFGCTNSLIVALASLVMTNENKVFGYAWFNAIGNLCGLVGPMAVGLIVDWTNSYIVSFYFTSAVLFVSALMYLFVRDAPHGSL